MNVQTFFFLCATFFFSSPLFAQEKYAQEKYAQKKTEEKKTHENSFIEIPESELPPTTRTDDSGFGIAREQKTLLFHENTNQAQVDRRALIDAMADHNILSPNAFTPKKFSFSWTNTNFFLNTFSFSIHDEIQLSTTINIPSDSTDFLWNGSVKYRLIDDANYIVSVQPFVSYQAGHEQVDIANLGFGGGVLADFYITDRMVISTGSHLFLNTLMFTDSFSYDSCQTHRDYLEGTCVQTTNNTSFPGGGHWLSVNAAMIYYIYDQLSLRLEAISGLTYGSFLGTEYLDARDGFSEKKDNFNSPSFEFGIPKSSAITLGAGMGWSKRNFGLQASAYLVRGKQKNAIESEWFFVPVLSLSLGF